MKLCLRQWMLDVGGFVDGQVVMEKAPLECLACRGGR